MPVRLGVSSLATAMPAALGGTGAISLETATVLASGATTTRTMGDRAADGLSVKDLGAKGDGATDDTASFEAAQNVRQGQGGGKVRVPKGIYKLAANAYTSYGVSWHFEQGATLSGPGALDAVADRATLNASAASLALVMGSTSNEHGMFITARAVSTAATAGYEKSGFIVSLLHDDASNYTTPVLKDLVGYESQVAIEAGNMTGRVWGFNSGVGPQAGADGYAVGGEFGVQSYSGSDAGTLGTPTSKIGVHSVAYGNSRSTAAFVASGNGTTFQDGYVAQTSAISAGGRALSVRPPGSDRTADIAYVAMDGSASFASLKVGGATVSGSGVVPVTEVAASGSAQTLTAPGSGNAAFDITLTANCTLTLAGGTAGQEQRVTVYLRQASGGGFLPTLPANVLWAGGTAPSPNTKTGAVDRFTFTTPDAGATWFGQ